MPSITRGWERVLLTGATGQIGAHILSVLLRRNAVEKVFCLVRAPDEEAGLSRLHKALQSARLLEDLSIGQLGKIVACPGDLADPSGRFGLRKVTHEAIRTTISCIIHNAWAVHFHVSLSGFETQSIRPTFQLVNLALNSPLLNKPIFIFVSSVATVLRHRKDTIRERRYGWEDIAPVGYGQSKWVAEEILAAAAAQTGLHVRVARLGQTVGDAKHGRWKASESYPTVVQCALTIGALPVMAPIDGKIDDAVHWLPVDTTATAIVDVALHRDESQGDLQNKAWSAYFSITAAQGSSWNTHIVPILRDALGKCGVRFEALLHPEWLLRLETSEPDTSLNPPRKMLPFFKIRYGTDAEAVGEPSMDMSQSHAVSPSLRDDNGSGMCEEIIHKSVKFWVEECWTKGKETNSKI